MAEIRNFVIISHIDHGKSTLADRFLELTNAVPKEKMHPQYLDMMDLEQEKGITIKMQPCRLKLKKDDKDFILNLVDTPGHIDFSYEVSRALAAVEGAVLLVDATQGIQAQTIYNLELAQKQGLVVIPAVNKIDSPQAQTKETKEQIAKVLNIFPDEVLEISAKNGTNIDKLIDLIIEKIPAPRVEQNKPLKCLVFDSKFDSFKGIIAYVRVFEGKIETGEEIYCFVSQTRGKNKEVGYFEPELKKYPEIVSGDIGYIATGIKETEKVRVGETITSLKDFKLQGNKIQPLEGYKEISPFVFLSIYPDDSNDFDLLKSSLEQLKLNDASLFFQLEKKPILGRGFLCGFLGLLHAEIITERLRREFGLELVVSAPSVVYKAELKNGKEKIIYSSVDWPDPATVNKTFEPNVFLEVITTAQYLNRISELIKQKGAGAIETKFLDQTRLILKTEIPLREIITDFYEKLKSLSQGFASMGYQLSGYKESDLVKVDILINGKEEPSLAMILPTNKAEKEGRRFLLKLKNVIPAQIFSVALQAKISGKIIARENISTFGRDVTAPLYGGDYTRKRKLLEKQKKNKAKIKEKGQIKIPARAFLEAIRNE
ncbi:MAG: translation elongation factor 4 [bacterium]|nr:translation elongation factor 4 [bacterium]